MTVGAILLAAGSARRMGEDKLCADLGGRPLALHALETIMATGLAGQIVALSPTSPLAPLIDARVRIVEVADHALGMGHSLAAAIRAVPADWTAAMICLADMPFVRASTLMMLAESGTADAIVRPGYEGRPGNPVLWGRAFFPQLATLTGDRGGRSVLDQYPVRQLACEDPDILVDVDTPAALAEARRRLERP